MKFIADEMHGKLIRWLRMLGYDTISTAELATEEKAEDPEEMLVERCLSDFRIAISNDRQLLKKIEARFYKLLDSNPHAYLNLKEMFRNYRTDQRNKPDKKA